ncbi:MAG: glutamyl-tRNA reductase [Flavobacteriaceae bacterium]|nr:glutamyl-tRNA reductase [Flavobacteriaceae bacterium]
MRKNNIFNTLNFYQIGLNYQKADAEIRGLFSLDDHAKRNLLQQAKAEGITGLLVISTCNRTELYGFAEHPYQLIKLLCDNTNGDVSGFEKVSTIHKNNDAISNLFKVGGGLQSQILGDFEIISQIKSSAILSKSTGMLNAFLERLVNSVIQASKRIKNETELSSGITSVSFASVQYILRNVTAIQNKNILLFGTGKIGRNTCENLVKHSKNEHITLINRTKEKAERIAGKFNLVVKDYKQLISEVHNSDIIIVATGANQPTINKSMIPTDKPLLILDLSIPKNVSGDVETLDNVTVIHLDTLSKITDETLEMRQREIPKAQTILSEVLDEFNNWVETRKFAPTINALRQKLETFKNNEIEAVKKKVNGNFSEEQAELLGNKIIQKLTNHFAHELRKDGASDSLALIQKMFQLEDINV